MKKIILKLWHLTCASFLLLTAHASFSATIPNTIIDTINGFNSPLGMAVTPDGKYVYVCNNGGGGPYLNVIDIGTNTVLNTPGLSMGSPYALSYAAYIAITPDGKYAYVTNDTDYVSLIDIATNTVLSAPNLVGPFNYAIGIAITPDGRYAYVANSGSNSVSVIDIATNTVLSTPALNGPFNQPSLIAITPNGQYAYVTNSGNNNVIVIDINTNTIAATITDPSFMSPYGIAITSDGRYVYVGNGYSTTISIIDTTNNSIINTIDGFNGPGLIAITPSGKYAYVTGYYSTSVSVVDLATNTIIPTPGLDTGFQQPVGIAITPDGQLAYISNYTDTTVSVIALPVSAPANLKGAALRNTFLLQSLPVNRITWDAPGLPLPVTYSIYRDAALTDLVATIPATQPLIFQEPVLAGSTHAYYVTGTDGVGVFSPAASVVITQPR